MSKFATKFAMMQAMMLGVNPEAGRYMYQPNVLNTPCSVDTPKKGGKKKAKKVYYVDEKGNLRTRREPME